MDDELSLKQATLNILRGLGNGQQWQETADGMGRVSRAIPGVAESLGRGAIAQIPGLPGDLESLGRTGINWAAGKQVVNPQSFMPNTADILRNVPRLTPDHEGSADMEMMGGIIGPGMGGALKDVAKLTEGLPVGNSIKNVGKPRFSIAPAQAQEATGLRDEIASQVDEGQVSIKTLTDSFDKAIGYHHSLSPMDRRDNVQRANEALAEWLGTDKYGNTKPLLSTNQKLMKAQEGYDGGVPIQLPDGRGVETTGLSLSPAYREGKFNMCPNSASCASECLGKTSGNYFKLGGGVDLDAFKGPRLNSLNRTLAMMRDPENFAVKLYDEIDAARIMAARDGNHLGMRLNTLSDINPRVHKSIIDAFPDVSFYDYTKNNTDPIAPNHHYTYSSTGLTQDGVVNDNSNWKQMRRRLDGGDNVAMAFSDKEHLPSWVHDQESGKRYAVVDGDTHDFRPLDMQPEGADGVVVGLKNKKTTGTVDNAHIDSGGFFVKYDPMRQMNGKVYARGPSPGIGPSGKPLLGPTFPTNDTVIIKNQGAKQIPIGVNTDE
jgi:hypothetical protein